MRGLIVLRLGLAARPLSLVLLQVLRGNPVHPENLNLDVRTIRKRIRHFVYRLLVHLHAVNRQTGARVQFLVANVTFEMLRLLMLHQNFLVIEFPVAVPVPSESKAENETQFGLTRHLHDIALIDFFFLSSFSRGECSYQHHGFDAFFFFLPIAIFS